MKRQLNHVLKVVGNLYLKLNDKLWGENISSSSCRPVDNVSKLITEYGMKLKCQQCGYTWIKTTINIPRKCPKCKSPYWNKPKVKQSGTKKQH